MSYSYYLSTDDPVVLTRQANAQIAWGHPPARVLQNLLRSGMGRTAAEGVVLAESRFEADTEGWSVARNTAQPVFEPTGGNPGGHLSVIDDTIGIVLRWVAPAKFLGSQSAAYNGRLSYDLRLPGSAPVASPTQAVRLRGGGLSLLLNGRYILFGPNLNLGQHTNHLMFDAIEHMGEHLESLAFEFLLRIFLRIAA